jgi:hypothetical protein
MSYRDDLDALSARHAALESEFAQKRQELEQAARMLEEAKARARLPVLDNIRVAAPCSADWTRMAGDERVRYCGDCRKNVYNLSGMTREEAEALIVSLEGTLCVRYFQRADGTILLADDCAVGDRRRRRRRAVVAGGAALLVGAGALAWEMAESQEVLGGMQPDPAMVERLQIERAMYERLGKYDGVRPDRQGEPAGASGARERPSRDRFE